MLSNYLFTKLELNINYVQPEYTFLQSLMIFIYKQTKKSLLQMTFMPFLPSKELLYPIRIYITNSIAFESRMIIVCNWICVYRQYTKMSFFLYRYMLHKEVKKMYENFV